MEKNTNLETIQPLLIIVCYHHYRDLTMLQVVTTYEDGSSQNKVALSTSITFHDMEQRAFFSDVARKIQHVIHNCKYIKSPNIQNK